MALVKVPEINHFWELAALELLLQKSFHIDWPSQPARVLSLYLAEEMEHRLSS